MFRLPALVSHYLEHRGLNGQIGFLDFLSMHYWGKDVNDQDQDKDNQLPFKSVDYPIGFVLALPVSKTIFPGTQAYNLVVHQPVYQEPNCSNPALASLFRPPRV